MSDLAEFRALLVGAGGFLGAAARYLVGGVVHRWIAAPFPYGTFLINVTGCFGIGFLAVLAEERLAMGPDARLFWMAGVLGGCSYALAAANVIGQVTLGLLAVGRSPGSARDHVTRLRLLPIGSRRRTLMNPW